MKASSLAWSRPSPEAAQRTDSGRAKAGSLEGGGLRCSDCVLGWFSLSVTNWSAMSRPVAWVRCGRHVLVSRVHDLESDPALERGVLPDSEPAGSAIAALAGPDAA